MYTLECSCFCDIGKVRTDNQDNYVFDFSIMDKEKQCLDSVLTFTRCQDSYPMIFGAFDGIGGSSNGKLAASLAAKTLLDLTRVQNNNCNVTSLFKTAIERMNVKVVREAVGCNAGMGTTAVLIGFTESKYIMCNVGDSRAFRIRDNSIIQLSKDHTDAALLERMNIRNRKPVLCQYIGISPREMKINPHIVEDYIKPFDIFILCTDGVTDMISSGQMLDCSNIDHSTTQIVENLSSLVLQKGGRDNYTIIIVKVLPN